MNKEKVLLKNYLGKTDAKLLALEVPVGLSKNWGPNAQTRYIDGVSLFKQERNEEQDTKVLRLGYEDFNSLIKTNSFEKAELIEVKRKLNRPVIGQVIAGKVMFKKDYPEVDRIDMIVVCSGADSALLEVCEKLDIRVIQINKVK